MCSESRIVSLPGVKASRLGNSREIRVYLPRGYDESPEVRYPVLYMHVGQLVFEAPQPSVASWRMGGLLDRLLAEGLIRDLLLVAVEHKAAAGANEYLHELSYYPIRHEGENYEHFLVEELKPLIDREFRTLPEPEHTALMGSSAAGIATYNIGLRNPNVFGMLGILSPFFVRMDPYTLEETVQYRHYRLGERQKAWLDIGGAEGFFMPRHVRPVAQRWLREGAEQGERLLFLEEPDAAHSEKDWGDRAMLPLLFFFGRPGATVGVQLHAPNEVGLEGPEAYVNAIVRQSNGLTYTDLVGHYESDRPDVLEVEPGGRLLPRSEGTAVVRYSRDGVEASFECRVLERLSENVDVRIEVVAPESTEADARVYANFELPKIGERLYGMTVALPREFKMDFLISRGYGCDETDGSFRPRPFRRLEADSDKTVRYEVEQWMDLNPELTDEQRREMVW